jgi:hypothetical protein
MAGGRQAGQALEKEAGWFRGLAVVAVAEPGRAGGTVTPRVLSMH